LQPIGSLTTGDVSHLTLIKGGMIEVMRGKIDRRFGVESLETVRGAGTG
jgi:hypothetical protein